MNLGIEFEVLNLGCGHLMALPRTTTAQLRRSHDTFFCPICADERHFPGKSDLEVEREKTARAERLQKYAEEGRASARRATRAADHRARSYKGHLTRQRKRSVAGTCPCCNRTFQQLARHMKSKHPKYEEQTP